MEGERGRIEVSGSWSVGFQFTTAPPKMPRVRRSELFTVNTGRTTRAPKKEKGQNSCANGWMLMFWRIYFVHLCISESEKELPNEKGCLLGTPTFPHLHFDTKTFYPLSHVRHVQRRCRRRRRACVSSLSSLRDGIHVGLSRERDPIMDGGGDRTPSKHVALLARRKFVDTR